MKLIFIFGNNLNSKKCEVTCTTMKRAMHKASAIMGVPECNLVFVKILDNAAKAA